MLKNLFIVSFRNALRNKLTSSINIIGLGLGLGVFILIAFFVGDELRVDSQIPDREKLFRVEIGDWAIMGPGFAQRVKEIIGEVDQVAMVQPGVIASDAFRYNGEIIRTSNYIAATKDFVKLFGVKVIMGETQEPLSDPYSLVLTKSEAKRLFGNENPIGKSLTLLDKFELKVTAVVEDSKHLHLDYNAIYSFEIVPQIHGWNDYSGWLMSNMNNPTYVKLFSPVQKERVELKISEYIKEFYKLEKVEPFRLRPINDVYFNGAVPFESNVKHGNIRFIRVMVIVALLILLLASINYINLSTARAATRAKEIGVRKATGASRSKILIQFLSESVITTFFSLLIAITFVEIFTPTFNSLIERNIDPVLFSNPFLLIYMILGSIVLGLISGFYPAIYLSSFQPVKVLKGETNRGKGGIQFRKFLIIFQFTVSVGLIIATLVIFSQINYFISYNVGFDKDQIITLRIPRKVNFEFSTFRDKALKIQGVERIAQSNQKPGSITWQESYIDSDGERRNFTFQPVDPDYIQVMGLELVEGRNFDWNRPSDIGETIIINQTFARILGLNEPVGTILNSKYINSTIIGVVKDYNFNSLHGAIGPLALNFRNSAYNTINVRINVNNVKESISGLKLLWNEYAIDAPFEYSFLNESYENLYRSELRMGQMFGYFAFIAIFIGCMGLFGLSTFILQRRVKEMGIRKVLGASTFTIINLMGEEFGTLVLISNTIAWPVSWYIMKIWLEGFPFRTQLNIFHFFTALLISLFIAFITVSYHSFKTAKTNPVDSLKYE